VRHYLKKITKHGWNIAQVAEHLPGKCQALSSNPPYPPTPAKKKKKKSCWSSSIAMSLAEAGDKVIRDRAKEKKQQGHGL
jgi:hypothetical protein